MWVVTESITIDLENQKQNLEEKNDQEEAIIANEGLPVLRATNQSSSNLCGVLSPKQVLHGYTPEARHV